MYHTYIYTHTHIHIYIYIIYVYVSTKCKRGKQSQKVTRAAVGAARRIQQYVAYCTDSCPALGVVIYARAFLRTG